MIDTGSALNGLLGSRNVVMEDPCPCMGDDRLASTASLLHY